MILYPNCKINLGLNIVSRRGDGYHNIETVFLPIPLCDCLEINPANEDSFYVDGRELDCSAQDNLVVRVLNMLRAEDMDIPPVAIRLTKNIPSGAGLGGGNKHIILYFRLLSLKNNHFHRRIVLQRQDFLYRLAYRKAL